MISCCYNYSLNYTQIVNTYILKMLNFLQLAKKIKNEDDAVKLKYKNSNLFLQIINDIKSFYPISKNWLYYKKKKKKKKLKKKKN